MKRYVKLYKYCDSIEHEFCNRKIWYEIKRGYCDLINKISMTGSLILNRSLFLQMDLCNEYMNRLLKIRSSWITEQLIYMETGKSVELASAAIYTEDVNGTNVSVLIVDVLDIDAKYLSSYGYQQIDEAGIKFTPAVTKHSYTNMLYKTYVDWNDLVSLNDVKEDVLQFVTETDLLEFENSVVAILDTIVSACTEYGNIIEDDTECINFGRLSDACLDSIACGLKKVTKDHNLKSRYVYAIISDFIMYDTRTVFGYVDHLYITVDNIMTIFKREVVYYDILLSDDESEKSELIDEYYIRFGEPFTVWQINKDYVFDEERMDSVVYNGEIYYCIESHRSTEYFDYSKWKSVDADTIEKNLMNFKEKQ